jgi:hypothetical protein
MCDFSSVAKGIGSILSPIAGAIGLDRIGNAVSRAFTPPGTGGQQALLEQQQRQNQIAQDTLTFAKQSQAQAAAASDAVLADQKLANEKSAAASVPAVDSEAARLAADSRLRKLLSAGAFGVKAGLKNLGDAPIGFRNATGA